MFASYTRLDEDPQCALHAINEVSDCPMSLISQVARSFGNTSAQQFNGWSGALLPMARAVLGRYSPQFGVNDSYFWIRVYLPTSAVEFTPTYSMARFLYRRHETRLLSQNVRPHTGNRPNLKPRLACVRKLCWAQTPLCQDHTDVASNDDVGP